MKIRIREFQGKRCVAGFYPKSGVRIRRDEVFEYSEDERELFERALATGMVEEVREAKRPGRPRKNEEVQPGA